DIAAEVNNPFCGDEVTVQARLNGGAISLVRAQARGCSLTKASASMMSEVIEGMSLHEIKELSQLLRDLMYGKKLTPLALKQLVPLDAFSQVRKFPIRIKCVLLAWMALEEGINSFLKKR
ncbi:MAG: Fe-S cluster assembly sulfur transfer protein SufU, partial [Dehalococcoidia bacterium]